MTQVRSMMEYLFEKGRKDNQFTEADLQRMRLAFTHGALSCNPELPKKDLEILLDRYFPLGVGSCHELPATDHETNQTPGAKPKEIADYDDSIFDTSSEISDWGDL